MTSMDANQVEQAMARLREQWSKIEGIRDELATATTSTRSKDRSVTAVVGSRGELVELKFHSDGYRAMAPAELSALLVEVIEAARAKMSGRVSKAFSPFVNLGAETRAAVTAGTRFEALYESLRSVRFGDSTNNSGT